jgi:hypothetical protein
MNAAREEAVMEEDRQQRILVAVDGSSASAAALGIKGLRSPV